MLRQGRIEPFPLGRAGHDRGVPDPGKTLRTTARGPDAALRVRPRCRRGPAVARARERIRRDRQVCAGRGAVWLGRPRARAVSQGQVRSVPARNSLLHHRSGLRRLAPRARDGERRGRCEVAGSPARGPRDQCSARGRLDPRARTPGGCSAGRQPAARGGRAKVSARAAPVLERVRRQGAAGGAVPGRSAVGRLGESRPDRGRADASRHPLSPHRRRVPRQRSESLASADGDAGCDPKVRDRHHESRPRSALARARPRARRRYGAHVRGQGRAAGAAHPRKDRRQSVLHGSTVDLSARAEAARVRRRPPARSAGTWRRSSGTAFRGTWSTS